MDKPYEAEKKVALVTGGSSGIGLETARSLARRGCRVYEISRRKNRQRGIVHIGADVTDAGQVRAAVNEILRREGRIDILICCAGSGISGAAEFTDNETAKKLLEVNLFGTVNCCKAVLEPMRKQNCGRIVCIGSVAGSIAIPFQAWYSLSKAAVNSYAAALRLETAPFGISVCCVLPGDIRTGFTAARLKNETGSEIYGGRIARSVAVMERDEENGMDPAGAGRTIARIALGKKVKPNYAVGGKYALFLLLFRLLPGSVSSWAVGKLYGG